MGTLGSSTFGFLGCGFLTFGSAFVTFGLGCFLTLAFLAGLVFFFFGGGEMSMVYWKVWLSPRSIPAGRRGIANTQLLFHPFSPVQPRRSAVRPGGGIPAAG